MTTLFSLFTLVLCVNLVFNISCACVGIGSFYSCMGGREGRRVGILLYNICMENPSITFPDPDVFGPILLISPLSTICI